MIFVQVNGVSLTAAEPIGDNLRLVPTPATLPGIDALIAAMTGTSALPVMLAPPTLTPTEAAVGEPVAVFLGTFSGALPTGVLRMNGLDVTGDIENGIYIPSETGTLTLTVIASPLSPVSISAVINGDNATAPGSFTGDQWTASTGLEPGQIVLNVSALPSDGGSAITAIEYTTGSAWVALLGTGTGPRVLQMPANGESYSFALRAVNAIGPGAGSATKSATSGAAAPEPTPGFLATALWVGAVTTDEVIVSAYAQQGAATMQAFAVPVGGGAEIAGPTVSVSTIQPISAATLYPSTAYGVARCTISGLAADTEYSIGVRIDGATTPGMTGRARTRPAVRREFTFGFGTCFEMNTSRTYANFDTMAAQPLEFFALLDDRGYADITANDPRWYYRADWGYLHHPKIGPFHRAFPTYYTAGDHDFSNNNSTAAAASKPAFMQWWKNHVPQPAVNPNAPDPINFSVWIAPDLKLVMADTRTNRTTGMFMDAAQEAWFIGQIQEVGAIPGACMIWNSGVPWISSSDTDTWFGAQAQRQRIADAVLQYAPGRVAIICGDMHALAFDDGTNSPGGMPVMHAAPLARATSTKGGPYTGGAPVRATETQYGQITAIPVDGGWQLDYRGYSCDATTGAQTLSLSGTVTLIAPTAPGLEAPGFGGASSISGGSAEGATITAAPGPVTGNPAPTASYRWFEGLELTAGTTILGTAAAFVRPAGVGRQFSCEITLDNGVNPDAVRIVSAAATTATGSAVRYYSAFSEFTAGDLTAPWAHRASTAGRPISPRFVFADVGGTLALTAPGSSTNDTAALLSGVAAGSSIQVFMEGETSSNNSSSLELHVYSTSSDLFYRVDVNPADSALRLRKHTGVSNAFDTLATFTVPQDVQPNVRVNILMEVSGGVIRVKAWNAGTAEPAGWQIQFSDPSPIAGPFRAGVGSSNSRPQPTIRKIGVALDGAAAPQAPL